MKNVKKTGEAAPANQEAEDKFPDTIKKITKGKAGFYADKSALLWKKVSQRKRSKHKDLRQEGIGQVYCFVQKQPGLITSAVNL